MGTSYAERCRQSVHGLDLPRGGGGVVGLEQGWGVLFPGLPTQPAGLKEDGGGDVRQGMSKSVRHRQAPYPSSLQGWRVGSQWEAGGREHGQGSQTRCPW